ncbi:exonuclease/endonuclease/phosphatase family protein, partial [Methanobrevibacter gottschalkii]|uniref:hypothetical protein n=1 Tax=Methanobrevibacter gottschalkii TaxID=190974 RepID=UPI0038D143F1
PFACAMAHGFADCRAAAKTSDTRPTFHNYAQDGGKAEGVVIDYIFAKNAKTVESFRVVTDKVNGRAPSDHYPLLAEIEL